MASYYDQVNGLAPKVWYRFNETAGTPTNSGSLSTTGSFETLLLNEQTDVDGRAIYFDGSSSVIRLNSWPSFSLFDDKSFTIETWFKLATIDTNERPMYRFSGPAPVSQSLRIDVLSSVSGYAGKIKLGIVGLGEQVADRDTISTNAYNDNRWHHVVVAVNTTSLKWYIDGNLEATKTLTTGTLNWDNYTSTGNLQRLIGASRSNVSSTISTIKYKGWLDEFAIYGYELTAQNVLDNFNAGASVQFADIPGTASALMLQPTQTTTAQLTAAPMTANADGSGHAASTVEFPTLLNTYMSGLTLQTWFKFDKAKLLTDYGTEPTRASSWGSLITSNPTGGIQGSGELVLLDDANTINLVSQVTANATGIAALLNDENFTIGFWTKKLVKEESIFISSYNTGNTENVTFRWNTDGGITFSILANNNTHSIASNTDITDGEWHFVVAKLSSNTMQLWIDNTSIGTTTMSHTFTLDRFQFEASTTDKVHLSQFFVTTAAAIGTTEIANIWDYGVPTSVQASAYMPDAAVKFNSSFNDYIQSKNPILDFRLDEGSGSPLNFGSTSIALVPFLSPQGYTQNEIGLNTRAFKFTDRTQGIRGNYTLDTGTFSTDDLCTIGILFKSNNATNQQGMVGFGGRNTAGLGDGNGFSLLQLATSGYLRIVAGNNDGTVTSYTGTTNYADGKWHLAVIVKEASTVKLYVDGKQHISSSNSTQMTDSGEFIINGTAGITNTTASVDKLIDEVFVTNTAFTAQEVFEAWQKLRLEMDTTATASLPMPTNIAGTGTTQTATVTTASALLPMPTNSTDQIPTINVSTASALFVLPNFGGNVVIDANYGHEAFIASALFHMPQYNIGEFNSADHMNASALMIHPISTGGGSIAVPTAVAQDAIFVMPGIVTIKGARIFAETLSATAMFPLPPAYVQLTDDDWFNLLLAGHAERVIEPVQANLGNLPNQSTTDVAKGGFLSFFDDLLIDRTATTATNFITNEIPAYYYKRADSYEYDSNGNLLPLDTTKSIARITNARASLSPAPILGSGIYDPYQRKAARVNNVEIPLPGTDIYFSKRPYNIEFSFKSTKKDQIIAYGKYNSFIGYARTIGVIGLFNGKLYLAEDAYKVWSSTGTTSLGSSRENVPATAPHPKNFVDRAQYLLGRTDVADGQWHHIIIQQGWSDGRTQIWVDGKLDRQIGVVGELGGGYSSNPGSDGTNTIRPYIIGFNTNDPLLYSDFETSAWNFYPARFITQDKILANFAAYSKWKPIKAEPMTATVRMTDNNAGKGNRARALLLYWWPKTGVLGNVEGSVGLGTIDNGKYGTFDVETFPLLTIDPKEQGPQQYYGWDVFPIDVVGRTSSISDMIKPGIWMDGGYRDIITGAPRYLDLINDIDISKFDAIFFKNYPEQTQELDEYVREELADTYFNVNEKTLHENFLKSLRAAVDTGISLYVTNSQLALDLGIIDRVEQIPDLCEEEFDPTDDFVQNRLNGVTITNTGTYYDTWRNNRLRVVNTFEDITNYPTYLWRDWMFFRNDDVLDFGGADRPYISLLDRPNGLQVGDEFIISDANTQPTSYEAVPFENVKAGTILTAFANTVDRNGVAIENPYKNHATCIAVPVGTILQGKATGGKIFVNFTERISSSSIRGTYGSRDHHSVELIQDKWINLAYAEGSITLARRNELLSSPDNLDRQLEAAISAGDQAAINAINKQKYWDLNGGNILSNKTLVNDPTGGGVEKDGLGDGVRKSIVNKVSRKGVVSTRSVSTTQQWFSLSFAYANQLLQVKVPSLLSNGFSWLADKIVDDGNVNRVEAMKTTTATLPMPVVTADKDRTVYAAAMLSNARIIHAPGYALASVSNTSLPLFADAKFGDFVKNIKPDVFTASAVARQPRISGIQEDEIVVYIMHVDPILYLREEVIK